MAELFHFGLFGLDLRAGELRKRGIRVKLQEQPLQILALLIESAGEVVPREQIQKKLVQ
jgi:DNA-binding winged helix-turn-helix (wHTH) protein